MIVNVRIEISDEQRRLFASRLAGKPVRRLTTRKDVVSFVEGCIAGACDATTCADDIQTESANSNLTAEERQTVTQLRAEGKDDGYIIGWLIGGRRTGAARPRLWPGHRSEATGTASLIAEYGGDRGSWGEHPKHPREDWRYDVVNGDTNAGYWDWVLGAINSE